MSIVVQQDSSHILFKLGNVFRRSPCRFARRPPSRSRSLCKPRRPSCEGRAAARGVLPGAFFEHSSFHVFSQPQNPHACSISQSTNSTMIRLLAAVLSRKRLSIILLSVQTNWRIMTRVLPNRNKLCLFSHPGSSSRCQTLNTFRSGGGPPPTRGRLEVPENFEAQGLRAHVVGRARTPARRPRNTP